MRRAREATERLDSWLAQGRLTPEEWRPKAEQAHGVLSDAEAALAAAQRRSAAIAAAPPDEEVLEAWDQLRAAVPASLEAARAALLRLFDHFEIGVAQSAGEDTEFSASFTHRGREFVVWMEPRPSQLRWGRLEPIAVRLRI